MALFRKKNVDSSQLKKTSALRDLYFCRFQSLKFKEESAYLKVLDICEQMTKEFKIHHRYCLTTTAIGQLSAV